MTRRVRLRIVGTDLPGRTFCPDDDTGELRRNVHVGVQRRQEVVDAVPGDAPNATFDLEIELRRGRDGRPDPGGPFVHGRPGARFVYLSWGTVGEDGSFAMFRRLKLWLRGLDPELLEGAAEGRRLEAHLGLTDEREGPRCGGALPEAVDWRVVDANSSRS